MRAFRADGRDSVATDEFSMRNPTVDRDGMAFDLDVNLQQPEGQYDYLLLFQAADLDGQRVPAWVASLSSSNPTADADANKTLNLERFVTALTQAAATVQTPRIAGARVHINRK